MKRYLFGWWSKKKHTMDVRPKTKWWHKLLGVKLLPIGKETIESWEWSEVYLAFNTTDECQEFIRQVSTINEGGIGSAIRQIMAGGYDKGVNDIALYYAPLPGTEPYWYNKENYWPFPPSNQLNATIPKMKG